MDTSRISEVKAPPHDGTPRSHLLREAFGFFGPFRGVLRIFTGLLVELLLQQSLYFAPVAPAVLEVLGIWLGKEYNHFEFRQRPALLGGLAHPAHAFWGCGLLVLVPSR